MFLTDHFLTEQQKAELLGSAYGAYAAARQRKKRIDQARQSYQYEIASRKFQMQLEQQEFDRNSRNVEWAVLAFIIFATLMSGAGMSFLLGEI